ncbi:MAG: hypothetical protein ACRD37_11240 [Candidatus Acidiferrales bacterium]
MRKPQIITFLFVFGLLLPCAQAKRGSWKAVEDLPTGATISVKAWHWNRVNCYFERATDDQLVCQPLQRRAPFIGPWPYPPPRLPSPPDYVFERQKVEEVRLEHSEGTNELIGVAIGGGAGAALGAARYDCEGCRGTAALIGGGIGALIGRVLGRDFPPVHRKFIYKR